MEPMLDHDVELAYVADADANRAMSALHKYQEPVLCKYPEVGRFTSPSGSSNAEQVWFPEGTRASSRGTLVRQRGG